MMRTFEEMIRNSGCFGLAYDSEVDECKRCEVKLKCETKCRMGYASKPESIEVATPEEVNITEEVKPSAKVLVVDPSKKKPPTEKKVEPVKDTEKKPVNKKPAKKDKPKKVEKKKAEPKPPVKYSPDLPVFVGLTLEEIEKMAEERGCDMEALKKYTSPMIRRMRTAMAIKKTYEIKD